MSNKKILREVYLEKRLTLTQAEYQHRNELLQQNILKHINFSPIRLIHIFMSIVKQKEVDTSPVIEKIKNLYPDTNFAISRTLPKRELEHFLLTDETQIEVSSWGIPEPHTGDKVSSKDIDLVFVPLISFDKKGNRIGYGGGYYDKFLSEVGNDSLKAGLSLSPALDLIPYTEKFDIPLDICITPFEFFTFNPHQHRFYDILHPNPDKN